MYKNYVLTLTGKDKVGFVEQVTKIVLDHNGNVDASRMAHLGGEFAMLMLISVPVEKDTLMLEKIEYMKNEGYHITICPTESKEAHERAGWIPYQVEVRGADHEGIIHHVTRQLAGLGINIEKMDTEMIKAPMSGTPLFMMKAAVLVPQNLSVKAIEDNLELVEEAMNVDVELIPYKP